MAKKSSIEKNNRRRKLSKKYSGRRARLRAIARDKNKPMEERFAATLKLAELPPQLIGDPRSQSLRGIGPATRLLPQAPAVAHRASGTRLQGADPGPGQVELVRRAGDGDERSRSAI